MIKFDYVYECKSNLLVHPTTCFKLLFSLVRALFTLEDKEE